MNAFKLGKSKPKRRIEEADDEEEVTVKSNNRTQNTIDKVLKPNKTPFDVRTNRDIRQGKIHVETLYAVFDNYRSLMSQSTYGASNNPFLLERRVHQLRSKLRQDLCAMGFEDILDFGFIPMPDPVLVGEKTARELEKNKGKSNSKKAPIEEDDED